MKMLKHKVGTDRGVALLIVLLITALLVALVFEFAYGTRVSLRAAVNFRDSQRAYFFARSGVKVFIKYPQLRESTPQGEWTVMPVVSASDTELRMRWEDEAGKIRITDIKANEQRRQILDNLFDNRSVSREVIDRLIDPSVDVSRLNLLSGLHAFMNDEDYEKIKDYVTIRPIDKININTASAEVLQSLGISSGAAGMIIEDRSRNHLSMKDIADYSGVSGVPVPGLTNTFATFFLTDTSSTFKVYSYATVGDYTKQVEAVVDIDSGIIRYWKAL